MLHKIDTVIVGGGQAGLAMSYYLTQEVANMSRWNERQRWLMRGEINAGTRSR